MLVTSKELFEKARAGHYAIPAPNYFDLDSARTYIKVAETLNKPVILACAQAHMEELIPIEEAALIGKYFAKKTRIPVVLHLDHGQDIETVKKAIELGFSSVMIDASTEPFERNIAITKEVVELAHKNGVVVEAEIGHVGAGENYENHAIVDSIYTEVADAVSFVKATKVDSLAVSIGTAHGFYKGTPKINFERLKEIFQAIQTPLVLHGGSSTGDENLKECAMNGISKINIFTDLVDAAMRGIHEKNPQDYFSLKEISNQFMYEELAHYYKVFQTR
ncbi:MAG: class II fructose-bisphosphate aldolase [Enterococcaceae bacterium]|jgi:fructose-bisphosphate aldolase class II|nr:class II fructose-bisphosphate aldolase [Enterococcaceae bacterium]MCI1919301.1 class II fructose-bisphosphate aldolase [Enterococcaceae bacterium]